MKNFIVVSKPMEINPISIAFVNEEIKRLHNKGCHVVIRYNDTHAIIIREVDDSIFWTTNYELLNYVKKNHLLISYVKTHFQYWEDFPISVFNKPRFW